LKYPRKILAKQFFKVIGRFYFRERERERWGEGEREIIEDS